jgi:alkylhydroperoxidase family enzyme
MARVPYVDPATAPEPIREVFARLPVALHVFRLIAHAETCFRPALRLGTAILGQQQLDARLRELAILRVARLSRAEYEWVQHVPIARAAGASEDALRALEEGRLDADCFDARDRALLRFTSEVVERVSPSDATFDALAAYLSPRELVELVLAIGFYMTMARLMECFRIDLDPPAGQRIVEAIR